MAGEGSLYRRSSDGRWVAEYTDATGRRRYPSAKTRAEAARKLRAALEDRDRGVTGGRLTLRRWVGEWLDQLDKAPTTVDDYRYKLSLLPGWLLDTRVTDTDLTPVKVAAALAEIHDTPTRSGKPRSASTVAQVRSVLRSALRVAQRYRLLSDNPAALVDAPKVRHDEPEPLTVAEAKALLAAVAGHRLESLYRVAISHGVRESEAIGALWELVDLDGGTLEVSTQWARTNRGAVYRSDPKTRKSIRTVALAPSAVELLRRHKVRLAEERLRLGEAWTEHGLVWPSLVGTPLGHRNLLRHLHRTCEVAGIRRVSFHTLRHSAATMMLAQGIPERVIADVLGHSDMRTLYGYAKVVDQLRRDAADAMDRALGDDQ